MKGTLFTILFVLAIGGWLVAEVEMIEIKWNAFKCIGPCSSLIQQNLNAIRTVSNVQIDAPSGTAVMGWDPNYPFSYEPFRFAAGAVGIKIDEMRIRVRGTITHDADNFYLISNGDGARFLLLGPIVTQPGRYIPRYSIYTHPLTGYVKDELLQAERHLLTVLISGPLYLPSYWPRVLIAAQVKIFEEESKMDNRFRR